NTFTLPGPKVSNHHCIFEWNGQKGERCTILLRDLSSNGTYASSLVNGHCIGTGQAMLVRDGNLICFGSAYENRHDRALDYRAYPPSYTQRFYKDYDMAGQLGSGAFATVFQAVDRSTGNFVAVKVIKTRNLSSAGTNSMDSMMHIREIEIMQKLHHEYIVDMKNVYNHEEEGKVYIVMELVEGGDLLAFALEKGPLPEHLARHFMYQICRALEYCHAKGITHRDLKPENILLTKDSPPTVKIADFGLGKMVDSLTHLKTMCGTPAYLAPEVLAQTPEGYSNAVDSWSVGVILFSILTLNTPFQEENESLPLSVRIRQRRVEWSLLDQPDFHISNACKNIIQRLLRTDPTERLTLTEALAHPWL
ncbi:Pkinase-domain-containing protein, partial [Fistulina hepatica ATCC 64428]